MMPAYNFATNAAAGDVMRLTGWRWCDILRKWAPNSCSIFIGKFAIFEQPPEF